MASAASGQELSLCQTSFRSSRSDSERARPECLSSTSSRTAAVYLVGVHPGEFPRPDESEPFEHPSAPVGGELGDVHIGVLFGGKAADFLLDSAAPVEYGAAYVPGQYLDVSERSVIGLLYLSSERM